MKPTVIMQKKVKRNQWPAKLQIMVCLLFFMFLMLTGTAAGKIIHVDIDAAGLDSGENWTHAFNNFQTALDTATAGDEIWVAEGIYMPKRGMSEDREAYFSMENGVAIYGGFNGTETLREDREPDTFRTIFSGDIGETGNATDNCYRVFYHRRGRDLDATTVLEGVTITGAYGGYGASGGMVFFDSSPTLRNCIFENNSAPNGGGLYSEGGSPEIIDCRFINNIATSGSCGGMYNRSGSPKLTGCEFNNNSAESGGGACLDNSGGTVSSTVFTNNSADNVGGGLLISGDATISDCRFEGNRAEEGAGIRITSGEAHINRCLFKANVVNTGSLGGGGIALGTAAEPVISNCLFIANKGHMGGGGIMARSNASGSVNNCTFYENSALFGQGIFCADTASSSISNSIFWGNIGSSATQIGTSDSGSATITYSNIDQDEFAGTSGNIRQEPLFSDPATDDFHLSGGSPCIDTGFPVVIINPFATCYYGNFRTIDGNMDGTVRLDMGAHEYIPQIWVDDDYTASGSNDGHTWSVDAFATIQAGIDAATNPALVHVAEGTYNEQITLANGISVMGADKEETTIDGIGLHGNVVTVQDIGNGTIFDGFTVKNGSRTISASQGTGMNLMDSSPIIRNCIFEDNQVTALQNDNSNPRITNCTFRSNTGSGMRNQNGSNPTIENCTFQKNDLYGMDNQDSTVEVTNCEFRSNLQSHVSSQGGGMHNWDSSVELTDCLFQDNVIDDADGNLIVWGGGGIYNVNGSMDLLRCEFIGNGGVTGGAVYNIGSSSLAITDCVFTANMGGITTSDGHGGAIYNASSMPPTITNSVFTGNTNYFGGAIYISLANNDTTEPATITNCIFHDNQATTHGGAIMGQFAGCALKIANSVFYDNLADSDTNGAGEGGALYNDRGDIEIVNSILWDNNDSEIHNLFDHIPVIAQYSDVTGGYGDPPDQNIDTDPLFMDAEAGNFRLQDGSPCVDTGTSTSTTVTLPAMDIKGNTRPQGLSHDMGVFEDASARKINVSPESLDFGPVVVTDSWSLELLLENVGFKTLTITDILLMDAMVFSISGIDFPLTLENGESADLSVDFLPDAMGIATDTLTILSDDPTNPSVTVDLSGQGVEASFYITSSSGSGGHIDPEGVMGAADGGNRTFTIVPDEGFIIDHVLVDGASIGAETVYTFTGINADHTIHAEFSAIVPVITTISGIGGSFNPEGSINITYGEDLAINIIPDYGYSVSDVRVDGVSVDAVLSYTFTHITEDHTIEADFQLSEYTITTSAGPGGTILPEGPVTAFHGDDISFDIRPFIGYEIAHVRVNGLSMGTIGSYTIDNIDADTRIEALFAINVYTVTAGSGSGGTISPSGTSQVSFGESITYTITPDDCHVVENVIVNGDILGPMESYTFDSVMTNNTIRVNFVPEIELLAPLGEEVYPSSENIPIQWRVNGRGMYLNLGYQWEGETERHFIYTATGDDFHVGSTSFTAPSVTGSRRLIVTARTNDDATTLCTVAGGPVTIIQDIDQPSISLSEPQPINDNALSVEEGDTLTIVWETTGCGDFAPTAVQFSTDNGATYPTTIANYIGCSGHTFDWTVALPDGIFPPVKAKIRVVWDAHTSNSVHPFTITESGGANHPPVAVVGSDMTVNENTDVTLSGAGSHDPDGDALTFRWERIDTTSWEFPLTGHDTETVSFTTPDLTHGFTELVFRLTVWDEHGAGDQAVITVRASMDPPEITGVTGDSDGWFRSPVTISGNNLSGSQISMRLEDSSNFIPVAAIPAMAAYSTLFTFYLPDLSQTGQYSIRVTNNSGSDETGPIYEVLPVPYQWDWGFQFKNPGGIPITWDNYRAAYGHDAITWTATCCEWDGATCVRACHSPLAQLIFDKFNQYAGGLGLCYGMSVASLKYFLGDYDPAPADAVRNHLFSVDPDSPVAANIKKDHISQISGEVLGYLKTHAFDLPGDVVRKIQADLAGNRPGVLSLINDVLAMDSLSDLAGHAVVPFYVEQVAERQWKIYVYDSNRPEASLYRDFTDATMFSQITDLSTYPYVTVHEYSDGTGQWQWVHGEDNTWESSGIEIAVSDASAIFHGLFYVPADIAVQDRYTLPTSVEGIRMVLGGSASMGIADGNGNTTGYMAEGTLVFNIPDAIPVVPLAGSSLRAFQQYLLPGEASYTVNIYGGQSGIYDFQAFCQGTHFALDGITAPGSGGRDIVTIDTVNLSMAVKGYGSDKSFSAVLVKEIKTNSVVTAHRAFEIGKGQLIADKETKVYLKDAADGIVYENHSDKMVKIDLSIGVNQLSPQPEPPDRGMQSIVQAQLVVKDIEIPAGKKVTIAPDTWDNLGAAKVQTEVTEINTPSSNPGSNPPAGNSGGDGGGCFLNTMSWQ